MLQTFTNLFHVLRRYKVAALLNLLGLSAAFVTFILLMIHARYEYGFDTHHPNRERIYQLENQRTDGLWESNFARPQVEKIMASSPHIIASGVTRGTSYNSLAQISISTARDGEGIGMIRQFEWIDPGFTEVFTFDMLEGSTDALREPDQLLIPESLARELYGEETAVGKPLYITELQSFGERSEFVVGIVVSVTNTIGGVYRDFPENSRLVNAVYAPIRPDEMINDWYTGCFYGYILVDSRESVEDVIDRYKAENADLMARYAITDLRARPLDDLYFEEHVRGDANPGGNKVATDILILVAFLVIIISSINFVNFSIALAPARIRNINIRKVLGSSVGTLRWNLVIESVLISVSAFIFAILIVLAIGEANWLEELLGTAVSWKTGGTVIMGTALFSVFIGLLAGIYPAWYMTSFSPILALSGSFVLTGRTRFVRKFLIGFQYVISFLLMISALFIHLQNKHLNQVDLGFDKENILEVKLSIGASVTGRDLYRQKLREHPGITDVAFAEIKFVQDEPKPTIGYVYEGSHHFQYWMRVSWNFPELFGIPLVEGRYFREDDGGSERARTVSMISRTNSEEMGSSTGDLFYDDRQPVEIVGIFEDIRFESLRQPVKPIGLWVASDDYNRGTLFNYSYVKIAGRNPQGAIDHIRQTLKEIDPSYPTTVRFLDERINDLYAKTRAQGVMVALFCLVAVLLSIIGVFGLVVFESQGRTKEIAIRKVMGSSSGQILRMFNAGYVRLVLICFVLAVFPSIQLVRMWLEGFTERISLNVWGFAVVFLIVLALTILTVTFQSYRAAAVNPAKSLQKG